MTSFSGLHLPSILVGVALTTLVVRLIVKFIRKRKKNNKKLSIENKLWATYLVCFFSGVLFTNALPHFTHGVSGEYFPAPFSFLLGRGFPEHLSNVIWGFINIVLAYNLFIIGKISDNKRRKIMFFAGVLLMGIFVCFVFSH